MASVDLMELVKEYSEQGVGDLLYSFIHNIVKTTCPVYPPHPYSPYGVWDESAIDDVCQDFTLHKLIRPGNLEHHLYASENTAHFAGMVKRDLRQYLINHARKTSYQRLRKRTQVLLDASPLFQSDLGDNNEKIWWITGCTSSETEQRLETLVGIMAGVVLPPTIRYNVEASKNSPIISNSDLERLLRETFTEADKRISFSLLMEAVRNRLNLYDDEIVSLNDPIGMSETDDFTIAEMLDDDAPSVETQAESSEIAVNLMDELTLRQKQVLYSYLSLLDPTQTIIAQQLGISIGTVNQELRTVVERIRSLCANPDDTDSVLQQLAVLLDNEQSSRE